MTIRIADLEFDHVTYDEHGDVLYLSIGPPRDADDSVVTPEGHVIRYDHGDIVGITLINAKWLVERDGGINISLPIPGEQLAAALA